MTGQILATTREGVTELRLNRPGSRNALSTDLLRELRGHLVAAADDPDVRVVILAGEGEAFCAGVDLREIPPDAPARLGLARWRLVAEVIQRLRELEQPTLAAVNGPAVGAGWGLALACDVCFAVAGASFWLPEVTKGFRLPGPLSGRLVEVAGPVRAAEIMFGGQSYQATDALAAGWVTRVVPGGPELAAQAWQFAGSLAGAPRQAVAAAKLALRPTASGAFPPPQFGWTDG